MITSNEVLNGTRTISYSTLNNNQTALLVLKIAVDPTWLKNRLCHVLGFPDIQFIDLKRQKNLPKARKPTFSAVIIKVEKEYTDEELAEELRGMIQFIYLKRNKSRANNEYKRLVRVITTDSYKLLLARGCPIYGKLYPVEPSKPTNTAPTYTTNTLPATRKFCTRCKVEGHQVWVCKQIYNKCPACTSDHRREDCPKLDNPDCRNCNQSGHAAYNCPKIRVPPENPVDLVSFVPAKAPEEVVIPPSSEEERLITLFTTILINLHKGERGLVQHEMIEDAFPLY